MHTVNMNIHAIASIEYSVPTFLESTGTWFREMLITDNDGQRISITLHSANRTKLCPEYKLPQPVSKEVSDV